MKKKIDNRFYDEDDYEYEDSTSIKKSSKEWERDKKSKELERKKSRQFKLSRYEE